MECAGQMPLRMRMRASGGVDQIETAIEQHHALAASQQRAQRIDGDQGAFLHVSAARPPEGADASPRGAANDVSVGVVS